MTRTLELEHDGKPLTVGGDAHGGAIVVGRGSSCAVRVIHPLVSREHVRIELRDDGVFAEDLGSSNGTYVGDARLGGPRRMLRGDRLRIGQEGPVLVFVRAMSGGRDLLDPEGGDLATMAAGDPRIRGIEARVEVSAARASDEPDPPSDGDRTAPIPPMSIPRPTEPGDDAAPAADASPADAHAVGAASRRPGPPPHAFALGIAAGFATALVAAAAILALAGGRP